MKEYIVEFDNLMLKGKLVEPMEQTIIRFLGGLEYEIAKVVQLQPYWSLNDVCKITLKVEKKQNEEKGSRYGYTRIATSKPTLQSKVVKPNDKKKRF